MFQKDMRLSLLLDFYGDILSERRRELIALYYNEDLSLSEIAENTGISRQGVRDSIKKSEQELLRLEETLALATRFESLQKQLADICKDFRRAFRYARCAYEDYPKARKTLHIITKAEESDVFKSQ